MGTRDSGYERADDNWYQEPPGCTQALFGEVLFAGGIHDPCCGKGTIVDVALGQGIEATGADIKNRASGRFPRRDFFNDKRSYPNIVFNPPNDGRAIEPAPRQPGWSRRRYTDICISLQSLASHIASLRLKILL